jgi:hypothetical protein
MPAVPCLCFVCGVCIGTNKYMQWERGSVLKRLHSGRMRSAMMRDFLTHHLPR